MYNFYDHNPKLDIIWYISFVAAVAVGSYLILG